MFVSLKALFNSSARRKSYYAYATCLNTYRYPLSLEGVFYKPAGPIKNAVIYFHGNTMNFYTGGARFLPPTLTQSGYAFLAFNRRGHDVLSTRNSRLVEGGALQTVKESLSDHEYAAKWLAEQGFPNPIRHGS
jgi:hypothetical protein